jgi:hypothetical protein
MGRLTPEQLRERAERTRKRTHAAKVAAEKRRGARKSLPSFDNLAPPSPGQTSKAVLNSDHVQDWFHDALLGKYGKDFIVSGWTVAKKKLAKDLLAVYGGELVHRAIEFFVASWDAIVANSNGNLSGTPSINLLFAMRERIFGDVQQGKEPLRSADKRGSREHRGPTDSGMGIGW